MWKKEYSLKLKKPLSFMASGYSFRVNDYFDVEIYSCVFRGNVLEYY